MKGPSSVFIFKQTTYWRIGILMLQLATQLCKCFQVVLLVIFLLSLSEICCSYVDHYFLNEILLIDICITVQQQHSVCPYRNMTTCCQMVLWSSSTVYVCIIFSAISISFIDNNDASVYKISSCCNDSFTHVL